MGLKYGKDLNQLQTLKVDLPLLSTADKVLVVEGNDVRALADGAERWYGEMRKVQEDPHRLTRSVKALGKGVLARNKTWASRREWVNIPPQVIADEVLGNVLDEELRAGLQVLYDMETLDAGLMDNLATAGGGADGTITGTASVVAKWGLGRDYTAETDKIVITGYNYDGFTAWGHGAHVKIENSFATRVKQNIYGALTAASNAQGSLNLISPAGGLPTTVRVEINTATQGFQVIDRAFTFVLGQVYHVYATWDGSNVRIYVDGVQQGAAAAASGALVNGPTSHVIGHAVVSDVETFADFIDNVTSYDRAPSQAQVLALAGRSIYEGGLLADSFDLISFRAEQDSRLRIVDGLCKAVGAEWFTDRDADDKDRFRMVTRRGSATATDSFRLGRTVVPPTTRDQDREAVRNDVIALGYGDGQNQLLSRIFHATTIRDVLGAPYTAADTGPFTIGDTTNFPTAGVVFHGMERILYSGKSATQLGTTSVTRAYTADGYPSLDAYDHSEGIAVWLHADTTTTPDTYYDPSSPQTGSSIDPAQNGHRQDSITDRGIIDQNTLDRLAQRLLDTYKDPRDSVWMNVKEDDVAAEVGDEVDLLDFDGTPLFGSPYRLHAYNFTRQSSIWEMDLGSPRDVSEAELAQLREEMRLSRSYGQGATNEMTVVAFDNIKGATTPPGIPLRAVFEMPKDAVFVNEVRVLTLAMQAFRSYGGVPSPVRTSSELVGAGHSHSYDRPGHLHTTPTLDIPDGTTDAGGTPSHTHPITYVAHGHGNLATEDPAGQATDPTVDGVPHSHSAVVGPHTHVGPGSTSAIATIGDGSAPDFIRPDSDVTLGDWAPTPLWSRLDEETPDDGATSINSANAGISGTTTGEVGLSNIADPLTSSGHIMRVRHRETLAGGTLNFVELRQGTTLIATLTPSTGSAWHTDTFTLSAAEADAITDYDDLRFRFKGTNGNTELKNVLVTWFEFEVPGDHTHTAGDDAHPHGASDSTDLGTVTSGNSSVPGTHDHSLDPDGGGHLHGAPNDGTKAVTTGTTKAHTHPWTLPNHDHLNSGSTNEASLTTDTAEDAAHDHSMQAHLHVVDIIETAYASPSVGLMIDGTDRTTALGGPWTTDQVDIDITEFVKVIGTHTLEFFEQADGKLGRLFTSTLVKFFIQSGVG